MAPSLIFLSLGTHEAPFTRAVDLMTPLAQEGHQLIIQHGYTPIRQDLPNVTWRQYMPYEDIVKTMASAETVVCHAGVGTIMTALRLGHLPIVIPRLQQHHEHVDDHQCDIAMRLDERGLVTCLRPGEPVPLINTLRAVPVGEDAVGAGVELCAAVATAVNENATIRRSPLIRRLLGG
jgi:UDP-N-acetylglucosamine--N-acetylmuramyl-(pentapeptide) pyrophosphoryl-undecaprenol N-acetylglucosamine transferase